MADLKTDVLLLADVCWQLQDYVHMRLTARPCKLYSISRLKLGQHVVNNRCETRLHHGSEDAGHAKETETWRLNVCRIQEIC